ncbi:hypothetical protein RND71_008722 [Anisodus tanguticus]|uniref:Glycosyltransferase N-terminal domain-containing protein n=1 Tax=Anisodus tanguticus TaxID=243964 RepID=A0AAE1SPN3_9SOLA|nr:hypothetical protein RND71_008722 [Anisodus tanguticus]
MGVPIAAWPIRFDQPKNGFLMKEIMKVGLIVREWEKREELVSASSIENVVRKLMASEEGDVNRKRTEELGEAVRRPQRKGELNSPNHELDNLKKQDHEVVIVMVPFPAQGHLNQLLQLACLISSSYDLPVYYVGVNTQK